MLSRNQTLQDAVTGTISTRRKEPRSYLSIQLKLRSQQADAPPLVIRTENLSRYGACLVTPEALTVGEVVTLTCLNEECDIRATVKYVRQTDDGWRAGVEFVAFPKKWLIMQLAVSAILEGSRIEPRRRRLR